MCVQCGDHVRVDRRGKMPCSLVPGREHNSGCCCSELYSLAGRGDSEDAGGAARDVSCICRMLTLQIAAMQ
jgi:hypothetical protein